MSDFDCTKYAKKSHQNNYACLKKGIDMGNHTPLPPDYRPTVSNLNDISDEANCDNPATAVRSNKGSEGPYECFKKGFVIGKNIQYGKKKFRTIENFDESHINDMSIYTLFIAIFIGLMTFGGLFIVIEVYWLWALIIGIATSSLFLYFLDIEVFWNTAQRRP